MLYAELKSLLPKADIVVLLVPLTPETHHLVDADFLASMKQGAMLVNAGRYKIDYLHDILLELQHVLFTQSDLLGFCSSSCAGI